MKGKITYILAVMACFASMAAYAEDSHTFTIDVGGFNRIEVLDSVNVTCRCLPDSAGKATFHAPEALKDVFFFTNKKGKLRIQVQTWDVPRRNMPSLTVYTDSLVSAVNSSNARLVIPDPHPVKKFKTRMIGNGSILIDGLKCSLLDAWVSTGNGTITLIGKCTKATYHMLGAGLIQADNMECMDVNCHIVGGGSIGCWPSKSLTSKGIGSTKIYYRGDPQNVHKSGGGKLIPLDLE